MWNIAKVDGIAEDNTLSHTTIMTNNLVSLELIELMFAL